MSITAIYLSANNCARITCSQVWYRKGTHPVFLIREKKLSTNPPINTPEELFRQPTFL